MDDEGGGNLLMRIVDGVLTVAAFWRKSSIRGQIVLSMFCITLIIEVFILAIIAINIKIISNLSSNYVYNTIRNRTEINMGYINL